jgi:crotonobetainyl-CoA:carnitine CoA-transferase CaiB-like acyl-CoA transferase
MVAGKETDGRAIDQTGAKAGEASSDSAGRPPALAGIRILDLTSVVMGPVCTQILAGYGAEVVKIEPPEGDVMRHGGARLEPGMGAMFLHVNGGKRSVVLDLKQPAARGELLRLLPGFDALVHNIRPEAMARLGLDYESVRALHPSIVYVEMVGYGAGGPYAGRAAYDDIIQAQVGIADLYATQALAEPRYTPVLIADRVSGITAAHATLAALFRRRADGQGERVTVPMFETMAAFVLSDHLGGASFRPEAGPPGYARLMTPHRRPYRTLDGYLAVLVYNEKHWRTFFEAIGQRTVFETDPRFVTAAARADHIDEIYGYLADMIARDTTAHWLALFGKADIPCCAVRGIEDLIDDPHLAAVGFFEYLHDAGGQEYRTIAPRYRSPTDARLSLALAPRLGEAAADYLKHPGT